VDSLLKVADMRLRLPGNVTPVDGVSFTLGRSECVGLVGESGCGKSLTSLSLMGLTRSMPGARLSGSAQLAARYQEPEQLSHGTQAKRPERSTGFTELLNLSEAGFARLRGRRIAMIFQDPLSALNPLLTIQTQLAESLQHNDPGLRGDQLRQQCIELLAATGIPRPETRLGQYPHQLSGGLRQRVMIAMALAGQPDLLIADEPTTALDVTVQAQILLELRRLQQERSMAVLFITHDLGVVAQLCSRVLVMYAGRVVEDSPAADFFRGPRHPYSRALLDSLPQRVKRSEALRSIPGSPPQPQAFPTGCRFHPRCERATEQCRLHYPDWAVNGRQSVACWNPWD
jgi:oligopeptide/dipeptide ABC transporter ATP-binding protein